jgi:hypothetical protein
MMAIGNARIFLIIPLRRKNSNWISFWTLGRMHSTGAGLDSPNAVSASAARTRLGKFRPNAGNLLKFHAVQPMVSLKRLA